VLRQHTLRKSADPATVDITDALDDARFYDWLPR